MARRRPLRRKKRRIVRVRDCGYCKNFTDPDYKDTENLKHFISERGKLLPGSITGICQKHQLRLARAVKQARYMALLPFIVRPS